MQRRRRRLSPALPGAPRRYTRPERFAAGVADLRERGFAGANVTVPHKRAALALADEATEAARAIGAARARLTELRRALPWASWPTDTE